MPHLQHLGFDLTDLGGGSYAVAGIPADLEGLNPVALVTDLVADACSSSQLSVVNYQQSVALSLARAAAIPQGQVLQNDEMESVVNRLFACQNVNYTPDGKAILCILPQTDIEQMLG